MNSIIRLDKRLSVNRDFIQSPNLCDRLSETDLAAIGGWVVEGYKKDLASRSTWETRNQAGMDLAMQVQKAKSFPWPDCSNVVFPLITIASLQFCARSYSNIIQGADVVRYRVPAEDPTGELDIRAQRISKHMSWQVLEQDSSWEEQHDRLLINLGIVGTNFIKTYYSGNLRHNTSELVQARDLVLDYYATSVEAASRKTHVIPLHRNEIYEKALSETFCDVVDSEWFRSAAKIRQSSTEADSRHGVSPGESDMDTPFTALEQHRLLDLDQDGYAEPYIVTVEESSRTVLRIVARFDREEDVERNVAKRIRKIHASEYFTKYSFIPSPDGGIYDIGFGTLLGPLNESVNSGINQLIDAGTMSNSSGGFLGRGAKIRGGTYTMAPWEWKRVDSTGDDLRKNLVPHQVREPSAVLFNLLSLLINYTDRISGSTDIMTGGNPGQNTPAQTSNNMIEQGMTVYSMIFKRVWRSMKDEFKKLHRLNAIYLPPRTKFGSGQSFILQEDYKSDGELVVPVADPRVASASLRMFKAQKVSERASMTPGYNMVEVERNFLRSMDIEGVEKFYPGPDKVPAPPSPQQVLEELKMKQLQLQMEHEKWKLMTELQAGSHESQAKIANLEAQALKALAEIGQADAAHQLASFDSTIQAMQTHQAMIDSRITALTGGGSSGDKDASERPTGPGEGNSGGVPPVDAGPDNPGVLPEPTGSAGAGEGELGAGVDDAGDA